MSADLLAEFESFYQSSEPKRSSQSQSHVKSSKLKHTLSNDASDAATLAWWSTLGEDGPSRPTQVKDSTDRMVPLFDADPSFHKEEDEWGDFEAGDGVDIQPDAHMSLRQPIDRTESRAVKVSQASAAPLDLFYDDLDQHRIAFKASKPRTVSDSKRREPLSKCTVRDENVLFDAEDEPEQDDYGDFETADIESMMTINAPEHTVQAAPCVTQAPLKDAMTELSLLDFGSEPLSYDTTGVEVIDTDLSEPQEVIAFTPLNSGSQTADESMPSETSSSISPFFEQSQQGLRMSVQPITPQHGLPASSQAQSPAQKTQAENAGDAWDVFQGFSVEQTGTASTGSDQAAPNLTSSILKPSALLLAASELSQVPSQACRLSDRSVPLDAFHNASPPQPATPALELPHIVFNPSPPPDTPAPTNIPSPLLILTLFTPLIELTRTKLLDPLAASHSPAVRVAILSHPNTQTFLSSYLAIATVLAHVIAGRKHRWKRDTALAQGMRIGPSGGGGSAHSGMKLMALDRGEAGKEDGEVIDVVRTWRASLGRLRTAVGPSRCIPEVAETLAVRVASAAEAPVQATKACALCGLKRGERVIKVDVKVLDAFGEWWIENWGHRDCANFWTAQSCKLAVR